MRYGILKPALEVDEGKKEERRRNESEKAKGRKSRKQTKDMQRNSTRMGCQTTT